MKKILTILSLLTTSISFSQITISANLPSTIPAGTAIETEVKISKGAVGNFAKYQMDVPEGYSISPVDVKGGNFTFEAQRAKIVWVAVPGEAEFSVKLSILANTNATSPGTFAQKFYYLENNEKKEVEAQPVIISVTAYAAATTEPTAVETVAAVTPSETKQEVTASPTESKTAVGKVETVTYDAPPAETKKTTSTAPVKETTTTSSSSEAGMTFKVQIGAYSIQPNKSRFAAAGNVNIDNIGGMFKVTTGNFNTKEEAIKFRDQLQAKGFSGFIVKYQNGQRIN